LHKQPRASLCLLLHLPPSSLAWPTVAASRRARLYSGRDPANQPHPHGCRRWVAMELARSPVRPLTADLARTSSATAPRDSLAWTVGGGLVFNNTKSNSVVFYLSSGVAKSSSATIDLSSGATKPNFAYCQFQLCGAQSRALDRTTSGCMGDVIVEVVPPPRGCTGAE
jgi:hypothetical protein